MRERSHQVPRADVQARRCRGRALAAAVSLLVLVAGCGGSDDGNADTGREELDSKLLNYDEAAFALDPKLYANADDIVTVHLEDPNGGYQDALDTGDEPGVDVIPYYFHETMERRFCWRNDPGADPVPNDIAPAFMDLQNETGQSVALVEQDGECVTTEIPAGRYRAVFRHGASARSDRDLLFILPDDRDDAAAAQRPGVIATPSFEPGPEDLDVPTDPLPYCSYIQALPANVLVIRITNNERGQPCGPSTMVPFEGFFLNGVCTDLSLLNGKCTYVDPPKYFVGTMRPSAARIYQDLFFRGPRSTLAFPLPIPSPIPPDTADLYFVTGPASMVVVNGAPTHNRDMLIRTNGCDQCNLSGLNLHGVDLRGAWLHLADLSHADLSDAGLEKSNALQTLFKSAYMVRTHLDGAKLVGAFFDSAGSIEGAQGQNYKAADLTKATLTNADLADAWMVGATLDGADFTAATLPKANLDGVQALETMFVGSTLTPGVMMRKSRLGGATFNGADMTRAVLTGADASGAFFTGTTMSFVNLQGATLSGARMGQVKLDRAVLSSDRSRDLDGCKMRKTYLANADFTAADMTDAVLNNARFYGAKATAQKAVLTNVDLVGAELAGVNFTGATLINANLDNARCVNCKFDNATMAGTGSSTSDGAHFIGTDIRGASFNQAAISSCDFTDAWVSFTAGIYRTGSDPELIYTDTFKATDVGQMKTLDTVTCPDAGRGPCNTTPRLQPRDGTPTPTPSRTATPTRPSTATATARKRLR